MPSYRAIAKGFINGSMHGPNERRTIVTRDEPFPKDPKTKKEAVPAWLKRIEEKEMTPAQKAAATKKKKAEEAAAKKAEEAKKQQDKEIKEASFLPNATGGESSTVETL